MESPTQLYKAAREALADSRLAEARQLSLALIAARPNSGEGYFLLGVAEGNSGRPYLALEALETAARLLPRAENLAQYARFLVLTHQYHLAREVADRASALAPNDAVTLDTIGCVFSRLGEHRKAVPLFQAAVARRPDHMQMRFNLASSLEFLGVFAEAEELYESIIEAQPRFFKAHTALSALRKQTPEFNHVARLEALLKSIGDGNEGLHLRYALAKEYEDLDDPEAAYRHLNHANRQRKAQLGYHIDSDRAIFERLQQRFSEPGYFQGESQLLDAPIFVFGLPRTGTTLVDRILSSHRDVHSSGELTAMPIAVKRLAQTNSPVVLNPQTIDAAGAISPDELGRAYLDGASFTARTCPRFIDKLPLNFFYVAFIARALPHAKLVRLRRGPLDVIWSNFKHLFSTDFPYYGYSHDLLDTAAYYVLFDRLIGFWRKLLPGRILEVQYESLVSSPESQSRRLFEHCGLDWSEECLRFHENASAVATPSARQVRQPIYGSSVGRWRAFEQYMAPARDLLRASGLDPDQVAGPAG